jgi:hypothetical protein
MSSGFFMQLLKPVIHSNPEMTCLGGNIKLKVGCNPIGSEMISVREIDQVAVLRLVVTSMVIIVV